MGIIICHGPNRLCYLSEEKAKQNSSQEMLRLLTRRTKPTRPGKLKIAKVMSWLINSMTTEVGENFLLYDTAIEMWEAAKETYSNNDNVSELFGVEGVLHDLRQGDSSVTEYFNRLYRHWQQLDVFDKPGWKCLEDEVIFKNFIEQRRIFKFLLGLNDNLDKVRGRILGTKPLPKIREVVSEVRREESRKKVMLSKPDTIPASGEASALAA